MRIDKIALWTAALGIAACQAPKEEPMGLTYPETRKDTTVVDDYFGTQVADPYRWLEDDMSEETASWVEAQNEVSFGYLEGIPYRSAMAERLKKLWNYEKYSAPFNRGDFTYFYKNDGLQNQSVLYRQDGDGNNEVFLDPNSFSEDGTTSLAGISFTKDGSLCAYQISEGGSDWRKVMIMDCTSMEIIEDTLLDVKFSGLSWRGNEGFYYSSYEKPKEGSQLSGITDMHKLYFHTLGTAQADDELIFGGEETPRRYISGSVSEDGRFLQITAAVSTSGNELYIQRLDVENAPIINIVDNFDNESYIAHTEGEKLFIQTNLDAPNNRVVYCDFGAMSPDQWVDLIPETNNVLNVGTAGGYIFCNYLKDATSFVQQYDTEGNHVRDIELPDVGSAGGFSGRMEDVELYYSFTNSVYPSTIFKFNVESGASEVYKRSGVDFNSEEYESKQVFYTSKDGTRVPMVITYKKGIELDGTNPTMLYGYGGFNISLTPYFSTSRILWLENGGVFAVANLRGGGEYGEEWHQAGTKMNKQNVFDDFVAAAEYLIAEGYTSSEKLGILGGSNGGLLVGAVSAQRPDLMAVAIPAVGVMDMLRYHKFTAGAGWAYDYGTSEDSKEMFEYLYAYSPVHALNEGTDYPATMVMTADHDDRVVPAHSFKYAAQLQACHAGTDPVIIRIETNAGHGAGKPLEMVIQEQVDMYAFAFWNMGVESLDYEVTASE
jgi:prolyl oligopeptidase